MLFCTSAYCYFFIVVFVLYWACPGTRRGVWGAAGGQLLLLRLLEPLAGRS